MEQANEIREMQKELDRARNARSVTQVSLSMCPVQPCCCQRGFIQKGTNYMIDVICIGCEIY
eukprot:1157713-Pelagomonas_calceolata.AAC.6